jgi:hypothetical protein
MTIPPILPPGLGNPIMQKLGLKSAEYGAKGAIGAVRLRMDEYAREIFDLWFEGKAPPVVTFENEKWETYMRAEPRVVPQVTAQLEKHAKSLQSAARWSASMPSFSFFDLQPFHLEVGSESGGYFVGYNVLHGTDKGAGDFKVSGTYRVGPVPGPVRATPGSFTVTYQDLKFDFGDMVDINRRWKADELAGELASALAAVSGGAQPRDYELHIKWKHDKPIIITVDAAASWWRL